MTLARTPARTFLALAVSVASLSSLQSLVMPVLPRIQSDLHTTPDAVSWTITAWLITAAVSTPLLGKVGDLLGKRPTFVAVLIAVLAGDAIALSAPDLPVLIVGRIMQGIGGALFPLSFGIIRDAFPARRMAAAIGAMSAVIAAGSGLGTVAAGPLSDLLGWRGLFLLPLAIAFVGLVLVLLLVPAATVRASGRLNVPAAILLSAGLVVLLLPLSSGARWGWTSPAVIGLFAAAVVLLAGWVVVELRSASPLVDMRTMRSPIVWTTNLGGLLLGAAMFGVFAYFARFVETPVSTGYGLGASIATSGLLMLPMVVTMAVAGFVSGPLASVIGYRLQFALGGLTMAVSAGALALLHGSAAAVAVETGLFGIGLGLSYASMTSIIVQSVPLSQTGVASGVNTNLRTIGGAIGTSVFGTVVFASTDARGLPLESGYTTAFLLAAAVAVVAAAVPVGAMLLQRRSEATVPPELPTEQTVITEAEAA